MDISLDVHTIWITYTLVFPLFIGISKKFFAYPLFGEFHKYISRIKYNRKLNYHRLTELLQNQVSTGESLLVLHIPPLFQSR